MIRWLVITSILVICSGCISIGDIPKVTMYAPQPVIVTDEKWPKVDWQLVLIKPIASDALDSARIAVRPTPDVMQLYQGASWTDTVPELFQQALLHAFEDSGKILAVGRQTSGIRGDVALLTELREFEAVYNEGSATPVVHIAVQAKLLSYPQSRVLASRSFRVQIPAADKEIPTVVNSFEKGLNQLITELVGWTLTTDISAKKEGINEK